jgi:O-antigen/teichoic acid export membrane protein
VRDKRGESGDAPTFGSSARSLFSGSAVTLVGTASSALLSTAYVSLGARWLGPADYGEVAATVSMANLFFMTLHPLETGLTLRVAALAGRAELAQLSSFLTRALRGLLLTSAALLFVWGASWAVLAARGAAQQALSMQWLGLFCAAALVQCTPRSGYRGRERFGSLAINLILESAVRLLVGLGLLKLGAGPVGMLAGYALGTSAAVAHGAASMSTGLAAPSKVASEPASSWADVLLPFRSLSAPLLGLNVYTAVVVNVDVLAATHFLPAHDAGLYAGASCRSVRVHC